MRRLLLGSILLCSLAAVASAATVRLIELRGHVRILALDEPILKGRVFVFHRYPDGLFLSVPAGDVFGIATTTTDDQKSNFQPGETIVLGPTGEGGARRKADSPSLAPEPSQPPDLYDLYPYFGYFGCCSGAPRPPSGRPLPPPLVGPNGFPGTPQREIGPNGFPILTPPPAPPR